MPLGHTVLALGSAISGVWILLVFRPILLPLRGIRWWSSFGCRLPREFRIVWTRRIVRPRRFATVRSGLVRIPLRVAPAVFPRPPQSCVHTRGFTAHGLVPEGSVPQ